LFLMSEMFMLNSLIALPASAGTPTMADLIQTILADSGLTEVRRRNVASSIRRFCAGLGSTPADAPAAFWFFRDRLEQFHPGRAGVMLHRWRTIRSDVAFGLKRIGLAPDQPKASSAASSRLA
jgi:hypothetical protein